MTNILDDVNVATVYIEKLIEDSDGKMREIIILRTQLELANREIQTLNSKIEQLNNTIKQLHETLHDHVTEEIAKSNTDGNNTTAGNTPARSTPKK